MEALTESRLRLLEGVYAKATKPPWKSTADTERDDLPVDMVLKGDRVIAKVDPEGSFSRWEECRSDGRSIAALHNAFPSLAAAARKGLQAEKALQKAVPIPTTPDCVAWAERCIAAETKLDELRAIAETLSPGPYQWAIVEPQRRDEYVIGNLNHGSGDTHMVILPAHEKADTGADPMRPNHAITMFITGNGPKSKDNALGLMRILQALTDGGTGG